MSLKPRLDLSDLSLHSPSSILGTPFDVSPRFEYPFPPSGSGAEPDIPMSSFNLITSPFLAPFPSVFLPTFPSSLPFSRPEARSQSPTHPKLQPRDPPVPPTLAKKRWSNTINGPLFSQGSRPSHSRKRSRSTVSLKTAADGPDEPIASRAAWGSEDSKTHSEPGDVMTSRRSFSPAGDTRRRLGKEPEVVHTSLPGPRMRDTRLQSTEPSEQPQTMAVSDIVAGQIPSPYPQNSPSTSHDADTARGQAP